MRTVALVCLLLAPSLAHAQEGPRPSLAATPRGEAEIRIDGRLDEAVWETAETGESFVERSPTPRADPPVDTRFRVLFDEDAIYVGVEAMLLPGEEVRALELRRDNFRIYSDDALTLKFDVAHDQRNTVGFTINPANAQLDYVAVDNGRTFRAEYDAVWESATEILDDRWVAELRIPLPALGIPSGNADRVVGFNVTRDHNARFATDDWAHLPPEFGPVSALNYGDLTGLTLEGGSPFTVIPYVLAGWATPDPGEPVEQNARIWGGGNARMRFGEDVWSEVTVLTDFSQVDIDDQQINLNRFPLFYPERRPFFINGLDIFEFGEAGTSQLFFSRRIGLDDELEEVPMWVGAKVYGHAGPFGFGLLDVLTGDPNTNWGVGRLRANIGEAGYVGVMATLRNDLEGPAMDAEPGERTEGYAFGIDGTLRFLEGERLQLTGAASATDQAFREGETFSNHFSGTARLAYRGHNFRPAASLLYVGDDYDPDVGFVLRRGIARPAAEATYVWFPEALGLRDVRLSTVGRLRRTDDWQTDLGGDATLGLAVNWPAWGFDASGGYEADVVEPGDEFDLLGRIPISAGRYEGMFMEYGIYASSRLNPNATLRYRASSAYFGGVRQTFTLRGGASLGPHFRLSGTVVQSFISIPSYADEQALTVNAIVTVTPTTLLSFDWIVQLNDLDRETTSLLRARWRYLPGSDIFFVYRHDVPYDCYQSGAVCETVAELTLKATYRFDTLL